MKQRLEWIDNIKGIGILCVVLGHISFFPFQKTSWMLSELFPMFYMSMFFMASGYVGYKIFDRELTWRDVISYKNFTLLIPFLILGLSYTALRSLEKNGQITIEALSTLFTNQARNGYWFIYSLFFFRFISIVVIYVLQKLHIRNFYSRCLGILIFGGGVSTFLHLFAKDYLFFYLLGVVFSYKGLHKWFSSHLNLVGILGLTGVILFSMVYLSGYDISHKTLLVYSIRIPLTVFVFMTISQWKQERVVGKFVNYCGHISLDIYVIHYFFLLGFNDRISSILLSWDMESMPFAIQLPVFMTGMFMVLIPSIFVSRLIHTNRLLERMILGKI